MTELNFRNFAENTRDGVLVCRDEQIVYANHSMEEMLGYDADELLDAMFDHIIHGDYTAQGIFINKDSGAPRTGQYEAYFKRKDDDHCPVEVTASVGSWDGQPAVIYMVRDISARKRDEAALREIETRFLQITNNIREVFFVRDLAEDRVLYLSPAYETIWKRPISAVYANSAEFMEGIHPDDKQGIIESVRERNITKQGLATYQYRILLPDGEVRWIRSRTFPVPDETGHIRRIAGIAEDITEQKLAEENLRLSEMQLRQIIDLVPHSIFVKDREGRFLLVNKAKADLYGTTVDELTGARQRDFHTDTEQLERVQADDQMILDSKLPKLIPEEDYVGPGGRHHILQTIKIPFITSKEGRLAVLGVATDITERKRAENALRLSEERLSRSLSYANIGVWDWHIQTGALYWSDLAALLFGCKPGAIETSHEAFVAAIHPEDRELVEYSVKACIEADRDYDIEYRVVWPDGSVHWLHESGDVVFDADGNAERMLGVVRDITARKLAEQALLESERKYRAIMENASDAILLATMDAWIFDANRRAEELLGYRRDELLQLHGTAIHPKEDHPTLAAAFQDLAAKGSSLHEHLALRKNGSIINVEVAATVINYQGEKVVMAIFRDTTARRRAEEERLTYAKTQRDTLVREVHHRIKNNLQGVMGLLRQHTTKNPGLRAPLEAAIGQVNSMAVVHGLYGQGSSEYIILCHMVRAICHSTGGLLGKTIEPHVTVDVESPVRVSNDEAVPLALVLNELIFNAIKHRACDTKQIVVTVKEEAGGAQVCIVTPDTQLPDGFDFSTGQGLGTGLNLVKSLLPPSGCRLRMSDDAAGVVTELRLSPPVLMLRPNP